MIYFKMDLHMIVELTEFSKEKKTTPHHTFLFGLKEMWCFEKGKTSFYSAPSVNVNKYKGNAHFKFMLVWPVCSFKPQKSKAHTHTSFLFWNKSWKVLKPILLALTSPRTVDIFLFVSKRDKLSLPQDHPEKRAICCLPVTCKTSYRAKQLHVNISSVWRHGKSEACERRRNERVCLLLSRNPRKEWKEKGK